MKRLARARRRIVEVVYPSGEVVGYMVWPPHYGWWAGPFEDYDRAVHAAFAQTEQWSRAARHMWEVR